jgi:hypothetical protein
MSRAPGWGRLSFATIVALAVVSAVGARVAGAERTSDPFAATGVDCPAAPSGWFLPDSGRSVFSPLTNPHEGPAPEQQPVGGYQMRVNCDYYTTSGRHLELSVSYALPMDPNPYNDFDIGCGAASSSAGPSVGALPWSPTTRIYRIVSATRWADAVFYDNLGQLQPNDVAPFEKATQRLMQSAEPAAHSCTLVTKPSLVTEIWNFSFDATVLQQGVHTNAGSSGSFTTTTSQGAQSRAVTTLKMSRIVLTVSGQGLAQPASVTLSAIRGLGFRWNRGATIQVAVKVNRSSYAVCKPGATGKLTISTQTRTVELNVCGRSLLQGSGQVHEQIDSVG